MLGLFRKILSRNEAPPVVPSATAPAVPARPASPTPIRVTPAVPRPVPSSGPVAVRPVTPPAATSTHVQVPLAAIAAGLPEAISHKVPANPDQFVAIPVERVLPQLSNGSVIMTAAELRECSPESFAALAGHDDVEITLPLSDIVKQLSTGHFSRREQKHIMVPSEVTPVFAPGSKGVSIAKPAAPQPTPFVRPQPTPPVTTTTTVPALQPVPSAAPKIAMSPQAMAAFNAKPAASPASAGAAAPRPAVTASPATVKPAVTPQIPAATTRKAVVAAGKKPPGAGKATGTLEIPLSWVYADWVEEVRSQLVDVDVAQSQIHVPLSQLEPAMKSGKVLFSWEEVASWIQPSLSSPPTPKVGEMAVELPLKTIAPLFLKQHRGNSQKRTAVDETIPDLFGGAEPSSTEAPAANAPGAAIPAPAVQAAPAPKSVPAAATLARSTVPAASATIPFPGGALRMAGSSAPAPEPKAATAQPKAVTAQSVPVEPAAAVNESTFEEIVGPAEKRLGAKEIVSNTACLPGIDGALLALNDGLLVTSQTAPEVKSEMIAAFIPQMFGRMNQYTKELAMGPLHELTLTVENGVWHVIKCNTIYFAVLGKRGENVPLNLLAQVAAELSSQSN